MGWCVRSSQAAKKASRIAPAAMVPAVTPSQPRMGCSMMPYTSSASPAAASTAPAGSMRLACGSRDSGTSRATATRAAAMKGTLKRKTEPQK